MADVSTMSNVTPITKPIANIVRVDVITEADIPQAYSLTDVYSEAEATAHVSEGEEDAVRVRNTIHAQNNFEDIVLGYDVRLLSVLMVPEILALIDGGEWDALNEEYSAPPIGVPVERIPLTLHVFTEEKDASGSTVGYVQFIYEHCKGTPVDYTWQDGEFFTPEMVVKSRPKTGKRPAGFKLLDELPPLPGDDGGTV